MLGHVVGHVTVIGGERRQTGRNSTRAVSAIRDATRSGLVMGIGTNRLSAPGNRT